MIRKVMLVALITCTAMLFFRSECYAGADNESANKTLFALADRLVKANTWKLDDVAAIIGRPIYRSSVFTEYRTEERPNDKNFEYADIRLSPKGVKSVWFVLSEHAQPVSLAQVAGHYGKWTRKYSRETFSGDLKKNQNYLSEIRYVYDINKGNSLIFAFDDDKEKRLRSLELISGI